MSLATIIAISSRLKESSDGFEFALVLNDSKITDRVLKLMEYVKFKEFDVSVGIRKTAVSLATIIAISSRLKESSDGLVVEFL